MEPTLGPKWRLEPCSHGGAILVRGDGKHGAHPPTHLQIIPIEDARLIVQAPAMREALERMLKPWPEPGCTWENCAIHSVNHTEQAREQARAILKELEP